MNAIASPAAERMPTLRQLRARMNDGHRKLLEDALDGVKRRTESISEARGYATCRATLVGWDCIEGEQLTSKGRELLEEFYREFPKARDAHERQKLRR